MDYKKFELYKAPYIRKADRKFYNSSYIMIEFIVGLIPVILIGWYKNGFLLFRQTNKIIDLFYPLIFLTLGSLFSYLIELFFNLLKYKSKLCIEETNKSFPIIPGLLLSIILPIYCPIWILFLGCFFGTFVGKLLFGGFGNNLFNPALVGYIFVVSAFYGVISNSSNISSDVISSATPLQEFKNVIINSETILDIIDNHGGLINLCFGLRFGSFAETSSIACLFSFVYYSIKKIISIRITLYYVFSFLLCNLIIGFFIDPMNVIEFTIFNLFTGGIIFGSIFMATEPVTSPKSVSGQRIYGIFMGIITLLLRLLSNMPDGTSTAILFMNMLTPIIDNFGAKIRVEKNKIKLFKKISYIFIVYSFITFYCIINVSNLNNSISNDIKIELSSIEQNYDLLNENIVEFDYKLLINNNSIILKVDKNGNIINSIEDFNNSEVDKINEFVFQNKVNKRNKNKDSQIGYISKVDKLNNEEYMIYCNSRGYIDDVEVVLKYANKSITTIKVDLSKEKELQGGLDYSNGTKDDLMSIGIGERSDVVSGVTYTSASLFAARKAGYNYINKVLGGINE